MIVITGTAEDCNRFSRAIKINGCVPNGVMRSDRRQLHITGYNGVVIYNFDFVCGEQVRMAYDVYEYKQTILRFLCVY